MFKVFGKVNLNLHELKDVILDVETTLNNRLLCYVEEDIELPELTPNLMMLGHQNALRKRAKYLEKCKQNLWSRWSNEYVRALREKHNLKHSRKESNICKGEVVIIHREDKNRTVEDWGCGKFNSMAIWDCERCKGQNTKYSSRKDYTASLSIRVNKQARMIKQGTKAQPRFSQ